MAGAPGPATFFRLASAQQMVKHAGGQCAPNAIAATKAVADDLRCLDIPGHWRREVCGEGGNCVCGLISVRLTDVYTQSSTAQSTRAREVQFLALRDRPRLGRQLVQVRGRVGAAPQCASAHSAVRSARTPRMCSCRYFRRCCSHHTNTCLRSSSDVTVATLAQTGR